MSHEEKEKEEETKKPNGDGKTDDLSKLSKEDLINLATSMRERMTAAESKVKEKEEKAHAETKKIIEAFLTGSWVTAGAEEEQEEDPAFEKFLKINNRR